MENNQVGALWRRLAIEGPVIVISILLAFVIDAWWDDLQHEPAGDLPDSYEVRDRRGRGLP